MSQVIVLIDDDQTFREVMARSLSRLGCNALSFDHPEKALEAVAGHGSPVVLLDLKLENDSGLRWIDKIKQTNSKSNLILLTGYASISTAVEAIKLGADDYLAKPITAREILDHIKNPSAGKETPINEKPMSVERLEWEHIQKVLADNDGNISASARALGMHRRTLQRKLAKKPARS
ncbi:MAG: response regulator [Kangiellaceae bacterium]|nr:response regulator [Kangiellaceae bacterium]MCW8999420.1 response regulator [Kangiellaceae bacterium]